MLGKVKTIFPKRFGGIAVKFRKWWRRQVKTVAANPSQPGAKTPTENEWITREAIEKRLENADDAMKLECFFNGEPVYVYFLSSLVDKINIHELVLLPLQRADCRDPRQALPYSCSVPQDQLSTVMHNLFSGYTVLLFPQRGLILQINTLKVPHRSINTPESESTVLGPQDSFVESLEINLSLIRRRINNPGLKVKKCIVGQETQTEVAVLYLEHIAHPENVRRAMHRVENVHFHGVVGLPVLKQMLEDKPYSPFPQFGLTSRPDNAVTALLDGRIVFLMNNSPDAAICPVSFLELFSTPEDFFNRWPTATLLRIIRFFGLFVTVLLTSSYVSVLTYHPEMLPPPLLTILTESRSKVPFPPVIEVLIIELVIEILREAGIRMPTKIGQTIGIVGGIVIGTAAVEAGLASNILIVVVSVSALLSFVPPNFLMSNAIRFVRYGFIVMAGLFGMYGQMLTLAFLFAHLLNLTSLGTPYMTTGIPRIWTDLLDSVIRAPMRFFYVRKGVSRPTRKMIRPIDEE
jgi:hypothetical protein